MSRVVFEILGILVLLVANGIFAMAEMSVVSSRKARLKQKADAGDALAGAALKLAESPNRFLSTVQVGITLVGVLTGAFGGASLAQELSKILEGIPFIGAYSYSIAFGLVVLLITYFSLVVGELVPKRLALRNPEAIARILAGPMGILAKMAAPVIDFLGASTDFALRLFGVRNDKQTSDVTEDEVKGLIREGMDAGVFEPHEFAMVEQVLALDRLPVREIMTPRPKIIWLNQEEAPDKIWHKVVISKHSVFPVFKGNRDHLMGVVDVKSMYAHLAMGLPVNLEDLVTRPLMVPETQSVTRLLDQFKSQHKQIALAADEFGSIVGLITLVDVLEAIAGDFPAPNERLRPAAKQRTDGSWLIDGLLDIQTAQETLPGFVIPKSAKGDFQTVAGFLLAELGRLPSEQDSLDFSGWHFEILDMDHHRIDKILATQISTAPVVESIVLQG
jgi:putative hemolysin